jgi:hypothetical protein
MQDGRTKTISLKVSAVTREAIEKARGDIPRSTWLLDAVDDKLRRAARVAAGGGEPSEVQARSGKPEPSRRRSGKPASRGPSLSARDAIRNLPSMR